VIGTTLAVFIVLYALFSGRYFFLLVGVVTGYAFAWVGHFIFEKNRPATFKYPLFSYIGDWYMLYDIYTGKRTLNEYAKK
jgi:hypothetical protein